MDWSTPIDLYCERTDASFCAEPANALSNAAFAIVVAYAAGAQALSWLAPPRALNGSVGYLPALVALIVVARAAHGQMRRGLELAAMIFTVSLALRTIDLAACDTFPLGTHFSWHLLNAVVLYVLLRTAIKEAGAENA